MKKTDELPWQLQQTLHGDKSGSAETGYQPKSSVTYIACCWFPAWQRSLLSYNSTFKNAKNILLSINVNQPKCYVLYIECDWFSVYLCSANKFGKRFSFFCFAAKVGSLQELHHLSRDCLRKYLK